MDPRRAALIWLFALSRRRQRKRQRVANPKFKDGELVFSAKPEHEFQAMFRLSKALFFAICEGIRHEVEYFQFVTNIISQSSLYFLSRITLFLFRAGQLLSKRAEAQLMAFLLYTGGNGGHNRVGNVLDMTRTTCRLSVCDLTVTFAINYYYLVCNRSLYL
jgi:hypothetical protein